MIPNAIIINEADNVAIVLTDIEQGETIILPDDRTIMALSDITHSHKVLIEDVGEGDAIIKYGESLGRAQTALEKGEWVHTHNMEIEED